MSDDIEFMAGVLDDMKSVGFSPLDELEDNSVYTIKVSGIRSKDGKHVMPDTSFSFMTPLSPMYCTVDSIRALVDSFGIPERSIRLYIRDASKYADYIRESSSSSSSSNSTESNFAMQQFVRTKVVLDCLTGYVMASSSNGSSAKYKLDVVEIQESLNSAMLSKMLDSLRKDLDKWQDAIRGYFPEGRAKPKATRTGLKASSNSEVSYTTVDKILDSISRTPPDRSD